LHEHRSGCPINLALEAIGDRWSLIILRDIIFGDRRSYRELQTKSLEGIATNILAGRLRDLTANGFLTTAQDPSHRQRTIYRLTEKAIALVPVIATLGAWGVAHLPVSLELSARAVALADRGPGFWATFMDELRVRHLGSKLSLDEPSPSRVIEGAYQAAISKLKRTTANGG
jgi:DNA-binding HxlR family transcriptional regulator